MSLKSLAAEDRWDEVASRLTSYGYLLQRLSDSGIECLLKDFAVGLQIPREHPLRKPVELIREAVLVERRFLESHPESLFQTVWNRGWWYDCDEAARHYELVENPPWTRDEIRLSSLLESWRDELEADEDACWLRSIRPPFDHLGSGLEGVFGKRGPSHVYATSPDGSAIAVACSEDRLSDQQIYIYETATGTLTGKLPGHGEMINALTWSPDGRLLASAAADVRVWDVISETLIQTFDGHVPQYWANGLRVDRASAERLHNGESSEFLRDVYDDYLKDAPEIAIESKGPCINRIQFLNDGKSIASCAPEAIRMMRVWDVRTGEQLREYELSDLYDQDYWIISPDESRMLTGESRCGCLMIDLETGNELYREEKLANGARSRPVGISQDGSLYAFAKRDTHEIIIVDATTFETLRTIPAHDDKLSELIFSPDWNQLATGGYDTIARIWNVASGECLHELKGHRPPGFQSGEIKGRISSLSWSPDGKRLATVADDGMLKIWDTTDGSELHSVAAPEAILSAHFLRDGIRLAGCLGYESIAVWNTELMEPRRRLISAVDTCEESGSAWVSPDGSRIAKAVQDHSIRVLATESGVQLAKLEGASGAVWGVRWFPDGERIVAASKDGTARIWSTVSGRETGCLRGHNGGVNRVIVHHEGNWIATGGEDGTVRIWDPDTGHQLARFDGHTADVHYMKLLHNGLLLSFSGCDNTTRLWHVEEQREVAVFQGDFEYHDELVTSPDGRHIVLVRDFDDYDDEDDIDYEGDESDVVESEPEARAAVYDASTGDCVLRFDRDESDYINSVTFVSSEEVAAVTGNGKVRVWRIANGDILQSFELPGIASWELKCDQDSRLLCFASRYDSGPSSAIAFDWKTGQQLLETSDKLELDRLANPNQRWIAEQDRETIRIIDLQSGEQLAAIPEVVGSCEFVGADRKTILLHRHRGHITRLLRLENADR